MRVERAASPAAVVRRFGLPLGVVAMLAVAVGVPAYLWYTRGRDLPLSVVLQAERYAAGAGETVAIRAAITPADASDLELRWSGFSGAAQQRTTELRWKAPREPGVHTVRLEVRRSGARAADAISLTVTERPVASYPLERPPAEPRLPKRLRPCTAQPEKAPAGLVQLSGRACRGAPVAAVLDRARIPATGGARAAELRSGRSWLWWQDKKSSVRPGPAATLWVPQAAGGDGELVVLAGVVDGEQRCLRRWKSSLVAPRCDGRPARGRLFADFHWQLLGPRTFRLAAKPPRGKDHTADLRYRWKLGGDTERISRTPVVVHRFSRSIAARVVVLVVERGDQRAEAAKIVRDRTAGAPASR